MSAQAAIRDKDAEPVASEATNRALLQGSEHNEAVAFEALRVWAENQRALARALGLSIDDWLRALERASARPMAVFAAALAGAMVRGHGVSVLDRLDGPALHALASQLIDPHPPRVQNPILAEAVRRSVELREGIGARRLRARSKVARESLPRPPRVVQPLGISSDEPSSDAPSSVRPTRSVRSSSAEDRQAE